MIKVAMSSDNHFDINHIDIAEMMQQQAKFLEDNKIDYYLIAGDLFNDFQQSLNYVEQLDQLINGKVRFIAGNHDMLRNVSYEALESTRQTNYLHDQSEDVKGTKWRLIGNNGWYDYSLSKQQATTQQFASWKNAYWVDQTIKQPVSDIERMKIVLHQVEAQLKRAQDDQKKVLFMTHFVPKKDFIIDSPDNRMWNMSNAMMGSYKMGELLEKYHVNHVLFGHLHIHPNPLRIGQTTYYNQAVGYRNNHTNEWLEDNFYDQWRRRLKIISLE
ncbi:metallophosphoesterase [Paucilactobacillus kaifaensis]|uniref:metallophosphoesterase n=1 Tax=Paucilactobacillus kaifaensis TaxID=2559921 RepID=UPI0010F6FCA4|nr:metallophosphoesterase [Paucilactobacillus kaifaensis]